MGIFLRTNQPSGLVAGKEVGAKEVPCLHRDMIQAPIEWSTLGFETIAAAERLAAGMSLLLETRRD